MTSSARRSPPRWSDRVGLPGALQRRCPGRRARPASSSARRRGGCSASSGSERARARGRGGERRTIPACGADSTRCSFDLSSLAGSVQREHRARPAWRFLEIGRRLDRALCLPDDLRVRRLAGRSAICATACSTTCSPRTRASSPIAAGTAAMRCSTRSSTCSCSTTRTRERSRSSSTSCARQLVAAASRDGERAAGRARSSEASATLVEMSWLPADADQLGSNGRREVIDRFVSRRAAPLLEFADQLNVVYFNDPTRMRHLVRAT